MVAKLFFLLLICVVRKFPSPRVETITSLFILDPSQLLDYGFVWWYWYNMIFEMAHFLRFKVVHISLMQILLCFSNGDSKSLLSSALFFGLSYFSKICYFASLFYRMYKTKFVSTSAEVVPSWFAKSDHTTCPKQNSDLRDLFLFYLSSFFF